MPCPPSMIRGHSAGDTGDPGTNRALRVVVIPPPMDRHEYVVRHVFEVRRRYAEISQQAPNVVDFMSVNRLYIDRPSAGRPLFLGNRSRGSYWPAQQQGAHHL